MDKKEAVKARINKLKHKNKKYKNVKKEETEKIEHTVEKKSVEKVEDTLPSNWSRYEINEHSDEEISGSANFETLLDKPLSQGSHFIFKNEENWSNNIEFHAQFQKYFMVDINLLNVGVATVPFTKRHGYDVR